jgi:hypothetical protein
MLYAMLAYLHALEQPLTAIVPSTPLCPIIAGKRHKCRGGQIRRLQRVQDATYGPIQLLHRIPIQPSTAAALQEKTCVCKGVCICESVGERSRSHSPPIESYAPVGGVRTSLRGRIQQLQTQLDYEQLQTQLDYESKLTGTLNWLEA